VAVIGSAYLNAILLDDISTTAIDDAIRRDDFELVLMTLGE